MPTLSADKLRKSLKRQKLLSQEVLMYQKVMEGIRQGLKFDNLLKLIVRSVCNGLGFKRAGVFLVDPDGKHIRLVLGFDHKGNFERNKECFPLDQRGQGKSNFSFSDIIYGRRKYFLTNNVSKRIPKRMSYRVAVFNNAAVPIYGGKEKIIGALTVDNLNVRRLITKTDVVSLLSYATQVGLAIESLRVHEKTLTLSVTDPLTGLYNRRFFDKALDQELKRCQRYGGALSLMSIDIDHFKRINDTFGHGAGDQIIRQVANLIRGNIRNLDIVARVGGEEFAVLLPETPPNNLSVVVNRLFQEVRQMKPGVEEMVRRGAMVTFSMGVASYRGGSVNPNTLMKLADQSLYQAKKQGRNRCGSFQVFPQKKR